MSDAFAPGGRIRLKPGRERSPLARHPWIYRGALAEPVPQGLDPLIVTDAHGRDLGTAMPCASGGSLALRMLALVPEPWSLATLHRRLSAAVQVREALRIDADAYRLVHVEGDGLSALVIDLYGKSAVIECFEPAWERYLGELGRFLVSERQCARVLLRRAWGTDRGVLALHGALPDAPVVIHEGRLAFPVDLIGGQKTGFFLDQRENRRRLGELARGRVLNVFSFSGAFSVAALAGGATRAVNVDASAPALALARDAYRLNSLACVDEDFVAGDAFGVLRPMAESGERFETVIVDPPAFVRRKIDLDRGLRAYKEVNLQALKLVAAGGLLLTCSCSALVDEEAFATALFSAALDAGRTVRILEQRGAGPDHPISLFCPQSRHLKAWFCHVE